MVDDRLHAATVRFLGDSERVVHRLARDPLMRSADERLRRLLEEADQLRPGPRPFEVGGIGHRSLERVAANGLFPNRAPQEASRSDRSFGSSAQGPARPFATSALIALTSFARAATVVSSGRSKLVTSAIGRKTMRSASCPIIRWKRSYWARINQSPKLATSLAARTSIRNTSSSRPKIRSLASGRVR